jgi:hypothetical protein
MFENAFTRRGERRFLAIGDELRPDHFLQPPHLHADGRLRAVEGLRGLGEAAFVSDGKEGTEARWIKLYHHEP